MSITRKASSSGNGEEFEKPPAGAMAGVCVAVIVIGTHHEEFKGVPKETEKIFLVWELIGEKMAGSKFNHVIGREYTLSLSKKAHLRTLIDGWKKDPLRDDEELDISTMLGKPGIVNVTWTPPNSEGKQYANVAGVTKPMKSQTTEKPMRTPVLIEEVNAETIKKAEETDWLPRIYGTPVHERMLGSKEGISLKLKMPSATANNAPMTQEEAAAVF